MLNKRFSIFVSSALAVIAAVAVAIGAGGPYATQAAARISAVVGGTYNPALDANNDGVISDAEALDAASTAIAARGGVRASITPAAATATVLPTVTPVPPATPETPLPAIPSATPAPTASTFLPQVLVGQLTKAHNGTACSGFDPALWHPAINPTTGCSYGYETGDPPPGWLTAWLSSTGRMPLMFTHSANTPGELANKPTSMKGVCLACNMSAGRDGILGVDTIITPTLPGAQVYAVVHVAANPKERAGSGLHSFQSFVWYSGTVGYYDNGWQDSGVAKYVDDGGSRAYSDKFESISGPRVRVGDGPNQTAPFWEQWYFAPLTPWAPTFAVTIGDAPVAYNAIERGINAGWITETHLITDTAWWPLTGGHGGIRNTEFVLYAGNIPASVVGAPFVHNQFGTIYATLAACQAGSATYRGVTYANACGEAFISSAFYNAIKAIRRDVNGGPPYSDGQFVVRVQVGHDVAGVTASN